MGDGAASLRVGVTSLGDERVMLTDRAAANRAALAGPADCARQLPARGRSRRARGA